MSWPWWTRAVAERLGLVKPLPSEEEFRTDPLVRLAAELMDPMHGVPIPPARNAAADIRAMAENRSHDLKPPTAADWPLLMQRCHMDGAHATFYWKMWYVAGAALAHGVTHEVSLAICEVLERAARQSTADESVSVRTDSAVPEANSRSPGP